MTIAKLKTKFTTCASVAQAPNIGDHHLPSAASAALATSDTMSRKPMPMIMLNDSSRTRSMLKTPLLRVRAGARQMRSSASCSSPKTVVAPTISNAMPTTVATMPSVGLLTACSMPCTAAAPCSPMRPESCAKISPRAASCPKTRPATAITISSSGAMENTV
ncbi:hypothetical protein D3C87_870080 [compost metagenome]